MGRRERLSQPPRPTPRLTPRLTLGCCTTDSAMLDMGTTATILCHTAMPPTPTPACTDTTVRPTTTATTERERLSQLLSQLPMGRLTPGCTTTDSATLGSTRTAMDITVWVTPMPDTIPTLTVVMDAGTDTELWSPALADNLHVSALVLFNKT